MLVVAVTTLFAASSLSWDTSEVLSATPGAQGIVPWRLGVVLGGSVAFLVNSMVFSWDSFGGPT